MIRDLNQHKRKEFPDFIINLYTQNYMSEEPVRELFSEMQETEKFTRHHTGQELSLMTYPPEMPLADFRREGPEVLCQEEFEYGRHRLHRLLVFDNLSEIQRVSAILFLNGKMIAVKSHFPHLATGGKNTIERLVREKYFGGEGPASLDRACLRGKNGVCLVIRDFVSLHIQYMLHRKEIIHYIYTMRLWIEKNKLEERQKKRDKLLKQL